MGHAQKTVVDFDEAIKKCGFGKFNYILIVLCGSLMGCGFIELSSVTFVMPVAECDLQLSMSDKGILSAIGYVGVILSSHLWGFLSDTKGRRQTLIGSLLIASVFTFVSSFVNSFWLLVASRFLNGFL
jgi:MFS transporter, VNT family, synaptic vesicle glycoprotein 2